MSFAVCNGYLGVLIVCSLVSFLQVSSQQDQTYCNATSHGESANITCYFDKDITKIRPIVVIIERYYLDNKNGKPEEILTCTWTTDAENNCEIKTGYEMKGADSSALYLSIAKVTAHNAGLYACKMMYPDAQPASPNTCQLLVEGTAPVQQTTATDNLHKNEKEAVPQSNLIEFSETTELPGEPEVSDNKTTLIVGLIVGVFVAVAVVATVACIMHFRKKKKKEIRENEAIVSCDDGTFKVDKHSQQPVDDPQKQKSVKSLKKIFESQAADKTANSKEYPKKETRRPQVDLKVNLMGVATYKQTAAKLEEQKHDCFQPLLQETEGPTHSYAAKDQQECFLNSQNAKASGGGQHIMDSDDNTLQATVKEPDTGNAIEKEHNHFTKKGGSYPLDLTAATEKRHSTSRDLPPSSVMILDTKSATDSGVEAPTGVSITEDANREQHEIDSVDNTLHATVNEPDVKKNTETEHNHFKEEGKSHPAEPTTATDRRRSTSPILKSSSVVVHDWNSAAKSGVEATTGVSPTGDESFKVSVVDSTLTQQQIPENKQGKNVQGKPLPAPKPKYLQSKPVAGNKETNEFEKDRLITGNKINEAEKKEVVPAGNPMRDCAFGPVSKKFLYSSDDEYTASSLAEMVKTRLNPMIEKLGYNHQENDPSDLSKSKSGHYEELQQSDVGGSPMSTLNLTPHNG